MLAAEPLMVGWALAAGWYAYVAREFPAIELSWAGLVLANGVYLPPAVLNAGPGARAAPPVLPDVAGESVPGLTPRQMDVLRCVLKGKPNKIVARELNVSEATVKTHLTAVFDALGVRNRTEAVYAAAKLGLRIA